MKKISKFSSIMCLVTLTCLVTGPCLNSMYPHNNFWFNYCCLFGMFILQFSALRFINKSTKLIEKQLLDQNEEEAINLLNIRIKDDKYNTIINLFALLFSTIFVITMYNLGFMEKTITGIYGCSLAVIVFTFGLKLYYKFSRLIWFVFGLKDLDIKNYYFYNPSLTEWISDLYRSLIGIFRYFVIIGSLYCSMYFMNLPDKFSQIKSTPATLTLIFILVFFVLAIPYFLFCIKHSISNCIYNCKKKSLRKLSSNFINSESLQEYLSLVTYVATTSENPISYKNKVFRC